MMALLESSLQGAALETRPAPSQTTFRLKHQSWSEKSLCVRSLHAKTVYYTTRWDALCPYVDVSEQLLAMAKKPLLIYALPPESDWGNPIRDAYGLVNVGALDYWADCRRARKFKELRNKHRGHIHHVEVIDGSTISRELMMSWGGRHFARYGVTPQEIDGFIDYVGNLKVLVLRVETAAGLNILTDVSILLPERGQVYGSFCQWNPAFSNLSPGLYACLLAAQWTLDNGYETYNLGPVGDYPYKRLFVNRVEPIYSLAICPADHPLTQDRTSPLFTDFERRDW
ncbi:MAG: GNAT family N-acetyltransferase, partial [Betaproteobacteria bacterium]|nr:GNAT family N-acetyltransferase [Betaproteobacteria bacterium]